MLARLAFAKRRLAATSRVSEAVQRAERLLPAEPGSKPSVNQPCTGVSSSQARLKSLTLLGPQAGKADCRAKVPKSCLLPVCYTNRPVEARFGCSAISDLELDLPSQPL